LDESVPVDLEGVVGDEEGETGLGLGLHADTVRITRALRIAAGDFIDLLVGAARSANYTAPELSYR